MIKCMVFVCSLERSVGLTLTKNKLFFDGERGEYTPGLCQPVSYYIITDIIYGQDERGAGGRKVSASLGAVMKSLRLAQHRCAITERR